MNHYPLAAIRTSPADNRDYPYVSPFTASTLPRSADLRTFMPRIENQLSIGSCTAHGTTSAAELLLKRASRYIDLSRLFLYYNVRKDEGRLGEEGAFLRDVLQSARKVGVPPETEWGYDIAYENVEPPPEVYAAASLFRLDRFELIKGMTNAGQEPAETEFKLKSALAEGLPVVVALPVGNAIFGLYGPWQLQRYPLVGAPGNEFVGGHCLYQVGYDDTYSRLITPNSWGTAWGDGGIMGLGYEHLSNPFFEAWALRGFAGCDVIEAQGIKLENLSRFRLDCRIVPFPSEVGTTVNVWIGALIEGVLVLRDGDMWVTFNGQDYPAAITGLSLQDENYVSITQGLGIDLDNFSGAKVYVAYGTNTSCFADPAHIAELCTIPQF